MLGPVAAGMAPDAEEERDRVVRGLGCRAVGPVLWLFALGCSRAVDGLQSRTGIQQIAVSNKSQQKAFSKQHPSRRVSKELATSSCCTLCWRHALCKADLQAS